MFDTPNCVIAGALRGRSGLLPLHKCPISNCRLSLLNGPSLSQQSDRSSLTRAAKQQRISQGRALNDLTRPLVVPRKLRANCEVCTPLNQ